MTLRILRLPDLDHEGWARHAALGLMLKHLALKSYQGYVQVSTGRWQEGRDTPQWRVTVKVGKDPSQLMRCIGKDLESACEHALTRLLQARGEQSR